MTIWDALKQAQQQQHQKLCLDKEKITTKNTPQNYTKPYWSEGEKTEPTAHWDIFCFLFRFKLWRVHRVFVYSQHRSLLVFLSFSLPTSTKILPYRFVCVFLIPYRLCNIYKHSRVTSVADDRVWLEFYIFDLSQLPHENVIKAIQTIPR